MQLSDIRNEVRFRAGVDANDGLATDTVTNSFINAALREVYSMTDWDFLVATETISTVVGTIEYTPAATWKTTIRLEDAEIGFSLQEVVPAQGARYLNENGRSSMYYIEGGQIHLLPNPAQVRDITHVYYQAPAALALDTDTPVIPDWGIDAVICSAAVKLAARADNTSQHRLLMQEKKEYQKYLKDEARRSKGVPAIHTRRDYYFR